MLDERTFLAFEKNTWLQALDSVPRVLSCVDPVNTIFLTDDAGLYYFAIVIVGGHPDLTFQDDNGFILGRMVVHWNLRARLQGIEETMAFF